MKKMNLKIWMLISMSILVFSCGEGGKSDVVIAPPCDCETIYFNKDKERYLTVNGDTLFTGTCESKFGDGKTSSHYEIKNGLQHGEQRDYFDNGQLKISAEYNNGELHGKKQEYYESGKLKSTLTYKNGETLHEVFYFANGYKSSEKWTELEPSKDGIISVNWFENGYPQTVNIKKGLFSFTVESWTWDDQFNNAKEEDITYVLFSDKADGTIHNISHQFQYAKGKCQPFDMKSAFEAMAEDGKDNEYGRKTYKYDDDKMNELNKLLKDLVQTKPSK